MNQAGFKAKSRTEDQLFWLTQRILDGFQNLQRTVFIDLQQAYDRVWRKGLFLKIQNLGIGGNLYNWIKYFLTDRLIQTRMNSFPLIKSCHWRGSPSGSCTLILIFINDLSDLLKSYKANILMTYSSGTLAVWHVLANKDCRKNYLALRLTVTFGN